MELARLEIWLDGERNPCLVVRGARPLLLGRAWHFVVTFSSMRPPRLLTCAPFTPIAIWDRACPQGEDHGWPTQYAARVAHT